MGTGVRIATASVRTDLAMTGFPWSVVHGRRATARVAPTEGYKECLAGGRTGASAPTVLRNEEERRGGALPLPRAGKPAKRHRWRMQRAGFEEVPRLADTTVAGNRLARRWAREPRPYGSATRGAMGGRPQGSPLRKRLQGVRCGEESPSHGFAVPAPFRQGGRGDGGTDCHGRFAPSQ